MELSCRRVRHRLIKHELSAVRGLIHPNGALVRPRDARRHVQQALNRYRFFVFIDVRHLLVGEQTDDRMIDAIQEAILDCDRRQRADNAFGDGSEVVPDARLVGGVIGLDDDPAVTHEQQAVLTARPNGVDKLGERGGIEALFFRRRIFPPLRRPDCFGGGLTVRRARGHRRREKT